MALKTKKEQKERVELVRKKLLGLEHEELKSAKPWDDITILDRLSNQT